MAKIQNLQKMIISLDIFVEEKIVSKLAKESIIERAFVLEHSTIIYIVKIIYVIQNMSYNTSLDVASGR